MGEPTDQDINRSSKVECCILKTVTQINKKLDCKNAISFGSAEINRKGGFVITEPGLYCLKEDVVFNPALSTIAPVTPTPPYDPLAATTVQAAITIRSSDVFLDLGAHTLSQAGAGTPTQVPYCVGILIPDMIPNVTDVNAIGLQSIYIKGDDPAIIDGFSMYGIRIFGHTFDIGLINLTVKNCGLLAQRLLPRPTVYGFEYLPHSNPFTTGFGPSFGVAGIAIGEGSGYGMGPVFFADVPLNQANNRTREVNIHNVSCLENYIIGLFAVCMNNQYMSNSHFDYNFGDDPGRTASPGLPAYNGLSTSGMTNGSADLEHVGTANSPDIPYTDGLIVTNCTCNNNQINGDFTAPFLGTAFTCFGALMPYLSDFLVADSQFNNTQNTFVTTSGFTAGFLTARGQGGIYQNCSFSGTTSLGLTEGFHVSGTLEGIAPIVSPFNVKWLNCYALNISNIGAQQLPTPVLNTSAAAVGFDIVYSKDAVIEDCRAQDITASVASSNPLSSMTATGFRITASAGTPTAPDDATVSNTVFRNCVASRCFTLNGGSAAGFIFRTVIGSELDAMKSIVVENCVSNGNESFTPTLTTAGIVQGCGFGFCVFQENNIEPDRLVSYPILFSGCKALYNKGLPFSNTTTAAVNPIYSSGIYLWNAIRHSLVNCDAIGNVYGIFLNSCDRSTVRDCRSDNNFDEGIIQTVAVNAGGSGYTNGDILTLVQGTGGATNATAKVQVTVVAGVVTGATLIFPGTGYTAGVVPSTGGTGTGATFTITVANIGEGYTSIAAGGSPAAPGVTTSTFENNRAFRNGAGNIHDGTNGNYNIIFNAAGPVREALLAGSISTLNSFAATPSQPTYFANLHNISTIG